MTKLLLSLIAVGIWANVLLAPVQAQEGGYIISLLMQIEAQVARLSNDVAAIKYGMGTKPCSGVMRRR